MKSVARLSNFSSRRRRALEGVRSSKTSSEEEGIFHNSSQNSVSEGDTSRVVRAVSDSRNLILEADAPIIDYCMRMYIGRCDAGVCLFGSLILSYL